MRHLSLLSVLLLCGCFNPVPEELLDGGPSSGHDAGPGDAGLPDGGSQNIGDAGHHDGGAPDAGSASDGGVLFGTVRRSCAPWDGPALSFELSETPLSCDAPQAEGFFVSLWIPEPVPGRYTLGPDFNHQGEACLCGAVANPAQLGSMMQIDASSDAGVMGRIDATFQGGEKVQRGVQVIWCPGMPLCG